MLMTQHTDHQHPPSHGVEVTLRNGSRHRFTIEAMTREAATRKAWNIYPEADQITVDGSSAPQPADPTRSPATQPYRTTYTAQETTRRLDRGLPRYVTGRLIVRQNATGWTLEYAYTDAAAHVKALFGVTEIPLPFTAQAQAAAVVAHVTALEPYASIETEQQIGTAQAVDALARELGRRLGGVL